MGSVGGGRGVEQLGELGDGADAPDSYHRTSAMCQDTAVSSRSVGPAAMIDVRSVPGRYQHPLGFTQIPHPNQGGGASRSSPGKSSRHGTSKSRHGQKRPSAWRERDLKACAIPSRQQVYMSSSVLSDIYTKSLVPIYPQTIEWVVKESISPSPPPRIA